MHAHILGNKSKRFSERLFRLALVALNTKYE